MNRLAAVLPIVSRNQEAPFPRGRGSVTHRRLRGRPLHQPHRLLIIYESKTQPFIKAERRIQGVDV